MDKISNMQALSVTNIKSNRGEEKTTDKKARSSKKGTCYYCQKRGHREGIKG